MALFNTLHRFFTTTWHTASSLLVKMCTTFLIDHEWGTSILNHTNKFVCWWLVNINVSTFSKRLLWSSAKWSRVNTYISSLLQVTYANGHELLMDSISTITLLIYASDEVFFVEWPFKVFFYWSDEFRQRSRRAICGALGELKFHWSFLICVVLFYGSSEDLGQDFEKFGGSIPKLRNTKTKSSWSLCANSNCTSRVDKHVKITLPLFHAFYRNLTFNELRILERGRAVNQVLLV